MSEVKIIKLAIGEELIATVKAETEETLELENVLLIAMGQQNLVFVPYMPYTKIQSEGVTIQKKNVLFVTDPIDNLVDDYHSATSKIVAPRRKPILVP
jgi:ribosomal protein L21